MVVEDQGSPAPLVQCNRDARPTALIGCWPQRCGACDRHSRIARVTLDHPQGVCTPRHCHYRSCDTKGLVGGIKVGGMGMSGKGMVVGGKEMKVAWRGRV